MQTPPALKNESIHIKMTTEMKNRIKIIADQYNLTPSQIARLVIDRNLESLNRGRIYN